MQFLGKKIPGEGITFPLGVLGVIQNFEVPISGIRPPSLSLAPCQEEAREGGAAWKLAKQQGGRASLGGRYIMNGA